MMQPDIHWMIATNQFCPLVMAKPSYIKMGFAKPINTKKTCEKNKSFCPPIDHLIQKGLSINEIINSIELDGVSITAARNYVYERKRALGYRRKSKQMEALEMMKKKFTDQEIADKLGMHKRYVRFLRVNNSRGRL